MPSPLSEIDCWVFDLDNTLYPASCRLFDQVDLRIGLYVQRLLNLPPEEARALQKKYFRDHTTTLRGLMINHGIEPGDFLDFVHEIDVSGVQPDARLAAALTDLPGRKVIFTNGTVKHAENVMNRLGITHHFQGMFDIADANFIPKPDPGSYRAMIERFDIVPGRAAMIDDMPRNLQPAADLGMTTVWIQTHNDWAQALDDMGFVHHATADLAGWLGDTVIKKATNQG
ncbi:pyrimidine 5'-nucleotidase [Dongia soli]|uniref:Pyrimidine 5'-nucleotidase n=1 Tax=Dongia soli TaxID=600628 RepID=A0ABU5E728_9PROT|nr:pyrimidine 5'-nucleotidase [Dongia soli]MDY0881661.1 pyrimidine 5'-nucleotidase [Dongia soli]